MNYSMFSHFYLCPDSHRHPKNVPAGATVPADYRAGDVWTHPLHLGHPSPCLRLCPGHQRPSYSLLCCLPAGGCPWGCVARLFVNLNFLERLWICLRKKNTCISALFLLHIYVLSLPYFPLYSCDVTDKNLDTYEVNLVGEEDRNIVEADSYWCMSKLLDGIQDSYTFAQPGIQTKVLQLGELMKRIDGELDLPLVETPITAHSRCCCEFHNILQNLILFSTWLWLVTLSLSLYPPANLHQHLERHEINYLQFSFRWFNNLLMREMPLGCTVRLWDTLHAEQDGFSHFVLYVCAAFLKHFSQNLMAQRDFQVSSVILLQTSLIDSPYVSLGLIHVKLCGMWELV